MRSMQRAGLWAVQRAVQEHLRAASTVTYPPGAYQPDPSENGRQRACG